MGLRQWSGWRYVALCGLNVALFVPLFLTRQGGTDFLPFTPHAHPHGEFGFDLRSLVEYPKAMFLRRPNLDIFRVSVEFAVLLVALFVLPDRPWVRRVLAAAYCSVAVFLAYHHAYAVLYRVEPALWEDIALLPSLVGFATESFGWWLPALIVGVLVAAVGLLFLAASATFASVRSARTPRAVGVAAAVAGAGVASLWWFGAARNDPVFQLPSKVVLANLEASRFRQRRLAELRSSGVDDSYRVFQRARLSRKPRFSLYMIEAYGQRLSSDQTLAPAFREISKRVDARLALSGYSIRTAFSNSPVYGGKSWLSIATVQTGVRIETPSIYSEVALNASRLSTVTRFFASQGYRTAALQPGNYVRDKTDLFARDVMLEMKDLDYAGQLYGYVGVPDQFSLRVLKRRVLDVESGPLMTFFMSLSTHHYFPEIPFEGGPEWPPLVEAELAPAGLPRAYVLSVAYEWRCLLEQLETNASTDAVYFVVGDHQPLLERTMDDVRELTDLQSSNTPVHVISRNKAFVDRFEKYGFVPGLFAPPGTGGLKHEGLQSLFVHEFVGEYGGVGEQRFTKYYPDGIGLGGLVAPASGDVGAGSERDGAQEQQGR